MRVLRDNGYADIAALLRVDRILVGEGLHEPHEVWAQTYHNIPLGSTQQAKIIAEIRANLVNGFGEAMRMAISILAETGDHDEKDHGSRAPGLDRTE
jgi:hypothetical protein